MSDHVFPQEVDERTEDLSVSRRHFIKSGLGVAGLAAAGSILAACTRDEEDAVSTTLAEDISDITEVIFTSHAIT